MAFEGDDGALPDLVILLSEPAELVQDCAVECVQEGGGLLQLLLLDFGEGFPQDSGLFFDVFQGECGICFEELETAGDSFEEGFLHCGEGRGGRGGTGSFVFDGTCDVLELGCGSCARSGRY